VKDIRANPKKFLTHQAENILSARKQLVVNADDFGFTPDVNRGIVDAHRRGILTATTLMANGAAFDDAVRLARETPTLDIGCHLVLMGGGRCSRASSAPATVGQLLRALARARSARMTNWPRRCGAFWRRHRPTHLDTHKHTHLAPPVLDAVARSARSSASAGCGGRSIFRCTAARHGAALKRLTSGALGLLRGRFHRVLARHGCRTTDHFAGFQITGRFRTAELVQLLASCRRAAPS
jgi:chitin disaccharide deacetylase